MDLAPQAGRFGGEHKIAAGRGDLPVTGGDLSVQLPGAPTRVARVDPQPPLVGPGGQILQDLFDVGRDMDIVDDRFAFLKASVPNQEQCAGACHRSAEIDSAPVASEKAHVGEERFGLHPGGPIDHDADGAFAPVAQDQYHRFGESGIAQLRGGDDKHAAGGRLREGVGGGQRGQNR